MQTNALISVIVPVYNIENYIAQTVQSILAQTYPHLEILLIDDGSVDKSGEICDAFAKQDERVRVIHKTNGGVSRARNEGLRLAKGEWIAFADGDDILHPTMYEKLAAQMQTGADISFCRFRRTYADGSALDFHEKRLGALAQTPWDISLIVKDNHFTLKDKFFVNNIYGSVWRSLFKREWIEKYALRFFEDVSIKEDRLFMLAYLTHCERAGMVDEYLYDYRTERTGSALTVLANESDKLYRIGQENMRYFKAIVAQNAHYTEQEKQTLIFYEEYEIWFNLVSNILRYSPSYRKAFKGYQKDEFFKRILKNTTMKWLFSQGEPKRRIVVIALFKCKLWGLVRLLSKLKK